ncbi:hypothetical protein [uncultured Mailhella sp.]|uniref:hypothetical protein n=1 Tax=uncultured Mailhella sp. TaxID=1981031 RepID=UPI0025EC6A89|nr:hypothetical protein [uncultured Mailhella sp.]
MTDDALKEHLVRYIASRGQDFSLPSGFVATRGLSKPAVVLCEHVLWQGLHARQEGLLDRLKKAISSPDEGFSDLLLRKIREAGMTNAECYQRAYIDRKLFSKILSDRHYRPAKKTVLAFALALELDAEQARELLARAGYALSPNERFDLAVDFFIRAGMYDIMKINEYLKELDLPLIGSDSCRELSPDRRP